MFWRRCDCDCGIDSVLGNLIEKLMREFGNCTSCCCGWILKDGVVLMWRADGLMLRQWSWDVTEIVVAWSWMGLGYA